MNATFWTGRPWVIWLSLWILIVAAYVLSLNKQRWDSTWTLHVAYSLWSDGDIDLAEFSDLISEDPHRIALVNGNYVSIFPDGAAFVAAPIVGMLDLVQRLTSDDPERQPMQGWVQSDVQEAIASVIAATTCILLGLIGRRMGLTWPRSILVVLIAAFATPFWSTMSRALWSHTVASLFITLAMLFLISEQGRDRRTARWWILAGASLGLAYLSRPTAAIPVIALTTLALVWDRKYALWLLGGGMVVAVLFAAHNLRSYGTLLPWYYLPSRLETTSTFLEALCGNLLSPSRGFWLYVPIWVLSTIGLVRLRRTYPGLAVVVVLVSTAHWIAISRFGHWWGGYTYGPRLMSDLTPLLMLGMIGWIGSLDPPRTRSQLVKFLGAVALIAASVGIHYAGANLGGTREWNSTPVDVGDDPGRLWDWSDPQMLRRSGVPRQDPD